LSYEVRPARSVRCVGLALDESGFIRVDRKQHTNIPGLMAAGDATGMPACAGTAIGEGIIAGFEAYRYVYRKKFGGEPSLFAYYGRDEPLSEHLPDLPEVHGAMETELLGSTQSVLATLTQRAAPNELGVAHSTVEALSALGEGPHSVADIASGAALAVDEVAKVVTRLMEMKLATVRKVSL